MASTTWKGQLTFGLVSMPVKLSVAARGETISFNQLHKADNSRVKQVLFCAVEDKPIPRDEIVKGFEYEKDRYVVISEDDIKRVAPKSAHTMEIQEFVKAGDIDPVFLESSYYVVPDAGGEKPYALLYAGMKESGYVAVAKITMYSREHVAILRPGLRGILMHTMYYADEVRKSDEYRSDPADLKAPELALAKMLIEALASDFDHPKYQDTYRVNLRRMIDAKVAGENGVPVAEIAGPAPVGDVMDALKKSLEKSLEKKRVPVVAKVAEPVAAVPAKRVKKEKALALK